MKANAEEVYLLDVSALIACIWTDHTEHELVKKWITGKTLATCPLSELGFLRISTNPKVLKASMNEARSLLESFKRAYQVQHLPADLPALQSYPRSSDEVTDQYLAYLAASHEAKLATLDTAISHQCVTVIGA
jgi:predicted nucleic acid-binding protein